jgi:hypothetical protein
MPDLSNNEDRYQIYCVYHKKLGNHFPLAYLLKDNNTTLKTTSHGQENDCGCSSCGHGYGYGSNCGSSMMATNSVSTNTRDAAPSSDQKSAFRNKEQDYIFANIAFIANSTITKDVNNNIF